MSQSLLEKLQVKDEKSILIQGLPSSIEKQFSKLAFSKNVTPWLKSKKIEFALVFAVNEVQLKGIISEVIPALHLKGRIWVAIPKSSSKIATTLYRNCTWLCLTHAGFEEMDQVALDHVWTARCFSRAEAAPAAAKTTKTRTGAEVSAVHEAPAGLAVRPIASRREKKRNAEHAFS